jgi:hypothetical protein
VLMSLNFFFFVNDPAASKLECLLASYFQPYLKFASKGGGGGGIRRCTTQDPML